MYERKRYLLKNHGEYKMYHLLQQIEKYTPYNEQEEADKTMMLQYMREHPDCLYRENLVGHFTTSIWTVNKERTKTLMVYHNIYQSWSWVGGHADGEADLCAVALRELQEETGVGNAVLVNDDIFSLEILTVNGHIKKGKYVPCHLHFNITYLAEADEAEALTVRAEENQAVKWWSFEDAVKVSTEPWMVERIYRKLIEKLILGHK